MEEETVYWQHRCLLFKCSFQHNNVSLQRVCVHAYETGEIECVWVCVHVFMHQRHTISLVVHVHCVVDCMHMHVSMQSVSAQIYELSTHSDGCCTAQARTSGSFLTQIGSCAVMINHLGFLRILFWSPLPCHGLEKKSPSVSQQAAA